MGLVIVISWVVLAVSTLTFALVGGSWRRVYFLTCALALPVMFFSFIETDTRWNWLNILFLYPFSLLETAMVSFPLSGLYLLYRHVRRQAAKRTLPQSSTPDDVAFRESDSTEPIRLRFR